MCDATNKKSFVSVLIYNNEVHKRLYYILDNLFFSSTDVYQTCALKLLQGKQKYDTIRIFPGYGILNFSRI